MTDENNDTGSIDGAVNSGSDDWDSKLNPFGLAPLRMPDNYRNELSLYDNLTLDGRRYVSVNSSPFID